MPSVYPAHTLVRCTGRFVQQSPFDLTVICRTCVIEHFTSLLLISLPKGRLDSETSNRTLTFFRATMNLYKTEAACQTT